MSKELNKTAKHTAIYAIGNILQRMVSFIMLPIYTRCLTPADYGILELLSMIIDFTAILIGLRVGSAIFRYYTLSDTQEDKNAVISTSMLLVGFISICGVVILYVTAEQVSHFVLGDRSYSKYVGMFSLALMFQSVIEIPLVYIRAQQRPILFVSFSVLKLIVQLGLNIYLVVVLGMRVEGVIYSVLISGVLMTTLLAGYTIKYTGFAFKREIAMKLISFSLPLVISGIFSFYLTFGDRYFLRVFGTLSDVGIYSLGYKFGFLLVFIAWQPFTNIWDSMKYEVIKADNANYIYQKVFVISNLILIFIALGIAVFIKDLLTIMSDKSFISAYKIVPIILLAYIFQCWAAYCSFGIYLKEKTMYITHATFLSFIVMSLGYLILIPKYHVWGAAWSTLVGFFIRFYWTDYKSKQLYDMNLPWRKIIFIIIIASFIYYFSLLVPSGIVLSITFHSLLMIVFIALLIILPIFSLNEKREIIGLLNKMLNRRKHIA